MSLVALQNAAARNIFLHICTHKERYVMKRPRVAKDRKRREVGRADAKTENLRTTGKRTNLNLMAAAAEPRRRKFSLSDALEFYRPLKKPVTLRLDADVLAWFKKDGRRYQTRINSTLRKVMEREMRNH